MDSNSSSLDYLSDLQTKSGILLVLYIDSQTESEKSDVLL